MNETFGGVNVFGLNIFVFLSLNIAILCLFSCKTESKGRLSHQETERIDSLLIWASDLIDQGQYDSARTLLNLEPLVQNQDCPKEDAICVHRLYLLGKSHFEQISYEQAILYFEKGVQLVAQIDSPIERDLYKSLKASYFMMSDVSNCLGTLMDYLLKSDTLIDHSPDLAEVYLDLAHLNNIQVVRKGYDSLTTIRSRNYINKAKQFLDSSDMDLSFRASFYEIWTSPIEIEERLTLLEAFLPAVNELSLEVKAELINYIRAFCYHTHRHREHLDYSHRYIDIVDQIPSHRMRNSLKHKGYNNLSVAYLDFDYEQSLRYNDSAFVYAKYRPHHSTKALNRNRLFTLLRLGRSDEVLLGEFDRIFVELEDWFEDKSDNEMVALMRRQEENLLLHQEKSRLLEDKLLLQRNFVILIACFGLLAAFFYYRMYKKQMTINNLQNKVVSGQLNPHFIGNAIYATMLMVEEAVPQAYAYLSKLHKFIRYLFLNYRKDFVSLHKEVDMLSNYIALEASKRKNSKLLFSYHIPEQLDHKEVLIMPMLLQPLVENAVKFSDVNSDNHIHLSFEVVSKDILKCVISDKGRGITEEVTQFPEGHSLYYIKAYNDLVTRKQSLILKPNAASKGTKAELLVKYRKGM